MWGGGNRRKPPNLLHFLLGPHCWQLRWRKEFNASHHLALHSGFVPSLPGPGRGSDWWHVHGGPHLPLPFPLPLAQKVKEPRQGVGSHRGEAGCLVDQEAAIQRVPLRRVDVWEGRKWKLLSDCKYQRPWLDGKWEEEHPPSFLGTWDIPARRMTSIYWALHHEPELCTSCACRQPCRDKVCHFLAPFCTWALQPDSMCLFQGGQSLVVCTNLIHVW